MVVIEKDTRMLCPFVQRSEITLVVRDKHTTVLGTPPKQFAVVGVLAELVLRLSDVVTPIPKCGLENPIHVFV